MITEDPERRSPGPATREWPKPIGKHVRVAPSIASPGLTAWSLRRRVPLPPALWSLTGVFFGRLKISADEEEKKDDNSDSGISAGGSDGKKTAIRAPRQKV
jgi:hypothetical protein